MPNKKISNKKIQLVALFTVIGIIFIIVCGLVIDRSFEINRLNTRVTDIENFSIQSGVTQEGDPWEVKFIFEINQQKAFKAEQAKAIEEIKLSE